MAVITNHPEKHHLKKTCGLHQHNEKWKGPARLPLPLPVFMSDEQFSSVTASQHVAPRYSLCFARGGCPEQMWSSLEFPSYCARCHRYKLWLKPGPFPKPYSEMHHLQSKAIGKHFKDKTRLSPGKTTSVKCSCQTHVFSVTSQMDHIPR